MIPNDTVKQILETAKIEEVVSDFLPLKRRGVNLIGLCPFHNEKTPSFNVSPVKNVFKCFGCGEGGDPVGFVMKHENCSFPEALRHLAKKYGIHIEEEQPSEDYRQEQQLADSLYLVNDFARDYYQKQLLETDYGRSVGLSYFKDRGFNAQSIERFGLGFANGLQNDLKQEALQQRYQLDILQKAGLVSAKENDFFRQRVMFPFYNLGGKIVGFGGRILTQDKKAPKYLNTPESEIYQKSKLLYGIFQAKKAIAKLDRCFLVEGYTDVISLNQAGIENVVASSGTSLTAGQILLIKRYTPNITLLYDGDAAGIKAALRGVDLILEKDMNVRVVLFPDKHDPDSYLREVGAEAFMAYVEAKTQDFILFKVELLLAQAGEDPIARAEVLRDLVESIAKVPDALKRSTYVRQCARLMEVTEELLHQELNRQLRLSQSKGEAHLDQPATRLPDELNPQAAWTAKHQAATGEADLSAQSGFQERDIVRILIVFGEQALSEEETVAEFILLDLIELGEDPAELFEQAEYKAVVQDYVKALEDGRNLSTDYFLRHDNPALCRLTVDFCMQPYVYSPGWERLNVYLTSQKMPEQNFVPDAQQALQRFKLKKIEALMRKSQAELKASTEPEAQALALKVYMRLHELRSSLTKAAILKN